jgi:hypothetical protein
MREQVSMRTPTTFLPALVLGIAGAIPGASPAFAVPIAYSEMVTVSSGSLGTMSLNGDTITLSLTADTVTGTAPTFLTNFATLTLTVGSTMATFSDQTFAEVFQSTTAVSPNAGFTDFTLNKAILLIKNNSLSTYDLTTPISLSGTAVFNAGQLFPTSDGNFVLNSVGGEVTFGAVPVPAPMIGHGLPVLLAGGGVLLGMRLLERSRTRRTPGPASGAAI